MRFHGISHSWSQGSSLVSTCVQVEEEAGGRKEGDGGEEGEGRREGKVGEGRSRLLQQMTA